MTNAALRGKPDAGNPHVRFDEGEVAPAATPRRGSLLYNSTTRFILAAVAAATLASGAFGTEAWRHGERQAVWPEGKIPDFQAHQVGAMTDEQIGRAHV